MFCHTFLHHSLWFLIFHATVLVSAALESERKVHIVYMGDQMVDDHPTESLHASWLDQEIGRGASELLMHSYTRSFNGFAAKLSDEEVKKIARPLKIKWSSLLALWGDNMLFLWLSSHLFLFLLLLLFFFFFFNLERDEVVSVFPSKKRKLHTTRSWNFIGFSMDAARAALETDVIIGMFDTGIWPESDSFSDEGFGPPPSTWKGSCMSSNFTCNKKIIGAKYYHSEGDISLDDIGSPRDSKGHGSHTASTAAGRQVGGVSLYGLAEGTVRGGAPSARIAVYKICWSDGCSDADILAAFDDAIADGVDVISLSVGGGSMFDYFEDSIAIGSFHAMKNGILTSNSGGNAGPSSSTIENYSPWSLTVAASTIDRRFVAEVKLGNGKAYEGAAINTFDLKDTMYPLVYAGDAPNTSAGYDGSSSRYCYYGSLDENKVKGKLVLCDTRSQGDGLILAGAIGAVMQTNDYMDYAFSYPLPTTLLGSLDGGNVSLYINTTSQPTANILKSQGLDDPAAPFIVSFSSRGPNPLTSDILKPDLSAPGVDILAAWSPIGRMLEYFDDKRSVSYNLLSGTSMACPHATGAAAYVKSFHPTWSPAAIKSALMTTASPMDAAKNFDAEFAYGAGQINPKAALNPGLVYDAREADYVSFLCGQGYSAKNLRLVTGDSSSCSTTNNLTVWDLNYPSFALLVKSGITFSTSFNRTVTNVGLETSTYIASVKGSSKLKISVEPSSLSFKSLLGKQSFMVKIEGVITEVSVSASLVLSDGVHDVISPIIVYTLS